MGRDQKDIIEECLAKERFEVIHTRVLHWDYGQKPEDETRERER